MSNKSRIASDVSAPGANGAYPVFAQAAGTYECPESWYGNFVTFFASGARLRFGAADVAVTAGEVSTDTSGVLTENVLTGVPVDGRFDLRVPEKASVTGQVLYFAIDADWTAYRSSNT